MRCHGSPCRCCLSGDREAQVLLRVNRLLTGCCASPPTSVSKQPGVQLVVCSLLAACRVQSRAMAPGSWLWPVAFVLCPDASLIRASVSTPQELRAHCLPGPWSGSTGLSCKDRGPACHLCRDRDKTLLLSPVAGPGGRGVPGWACPFPGLHVVSKPGQGVLDSVLSPVQQIRGA